MSNFITASLMGRAANQMFIHATSQALALEHGVEYLADPKPDTHYEPNYFRGKFKELSNEKVEFEFNEPHDGFVNIPFQPNMRLVGYWQARAYFEKYEDVIFPMFGINPVVNMDAVSLHLRLTDFTTIIGKHCVLSESYIQQAIRFYQGKGYGKFIVCSDDIPKAKSFLAGKFSDSDIVFSEGKSALEDMALIAGCAHQILSASTFSYFCYMLNPNKQKSCIMPDRLWGNTHQSSFQEWYENSIRMDNDGVINKKDSKYHFTTPVVSEIIEEPKVIPEIFQWRKAYARYVNLDSRPDRNERMKQTLSAAGINAERIRGILPSELDVTNPKYKAMAARPQKGAMGCFESQLSIMKQALAENRDAIVLEDDLVLSSDAAKRLDIYQEFLNKNSWDVAYWGATFHIKPEWHKAGHPNLPSCNCDLNRDFELTDNPHIVKVMGEWGTYAYCVNKNSLEKVIKLLEDTMCDSIGIDYSFISLATKLNCYAFVSGFAKQYNNRSDIGDGETLFENFRFLGAHFWSDKLEDFDPSTYNWGEAAIRTQPSLEAKPESTEVLHEVVREPIKFEANTPEWFLQQAGIYYSLKDAGLLEATLVSINKHTKHKLETNLDGLQKELLGTCRFDCSFYVNKYKQL